MLSEIENLHEIWLSNKSGKTTDHQISFDELKNSIISTGPFSFFIIDFFDMSLSNFSPSFYEMFAFDSENLSMSDILGAIHPDDISFVVKAEEFLTHFF